MTINLIDHKIHGGHDQHPALAKARQQNSEPADQAGYHCQRTRNGEKRTFTLPDNEKHLGIEIAHAQKNARDRP